MTILLEAHKQAKQSIIDRLEALATISADAGMRTLSADIRQARIPKLQNERFHLVILGEFNHGKSTFVNALLGADVLPTGITPTTAALNHVIYSDQPRARAITKAGEIIDLAPTALAEWVTVGGGRADDVTYVEVGYPAELLRENITLVDTPGVNDLNEQRADITYGYVPRADAVVFLLDAGQALKDSEREFLASHVLAGSRDRMIFVLGKIDLLSENERAAVTDYVKKGLRTLIPDPVVFPLSARMHLTGATESSGMRPLLAYLERFLDTDRAQILLDNAAADASRTAAYLQQNLGLKLRAYDLDLEDLEGRVAQVRKQLDSSKRQLDELHTRIGAEAKAIKAQVRLDLDHFARAFCDALAREIDAVDGADVKKYLHGFLEDKFKEWAELEGHRLVVLLESLAEDVIAVTNENVATTSAMLADRLGPEDTKIDIDVDSFKYDVGIYAVGALGTTVFLFVNTLAGGLLTLAAPVLAIVLKSKISGDIKVQAKERAPAAVTRAAEAMRPHFDRCVDEFATRLSAFVTAAGNALYKGISEILDKTLEDRTVRGSEVDSLRAATADHVTAVIAAQTSLTQLRGHLWNPVEQPPVPDEATSDEAASVDDDGAPADPDRD
ncbi:MAG TPA: dynamin family protein [Kofleriaceae bacterium]|nr:dynamin family protein [Kofleriaceae bacterium]